MPEGVSVDAVDWLPSGAASGLLRVRGRTAGAVEGLPDLVIVAGDRPHRFTSLPDPRGGQERGGWRGAYVVGAALVATAGREMVLEWPDGSRLTLPGVDAEAPEAGAPPEDEPGGEVVDRAVLAERRARRAEAAEHAQARIAREALRAVEVLELRANELEAKLREQPPPAPAAPDGPAGDEVAGMLDRLAGAEAREQELREQVAALQAALADRDAAAAAPDADRRAERLRDALASTIVTVGRLRLELHEAQLTRRTRDVASGADAVRRTVAERERAALADALAAAREQLAAGAHAGARVAEVEAAHEQTLRELQASQAELGAARRRVDELEAEVAAARAQAEAAAERAEAAAREAGVRAAEAARDAGQQAAAVAHQAEQRAAAAEAALAEVAGRVEAAEARMRAAEVAREIAEAAAVAAVSERRAAEVAHAARTASLEAELAAARERSAAEPSPPPVPPQLAERAAEQAVAAQSAQPTADRQRVLADLDAAAAALRRAPDPVLPTQPPGPMIVSAPSAPPSSLARGGGGRSYPPLRGALVRLAHDDPRAAGEVIAGLLPAQWRVLETPLEYTLAIRELDEEVPVSVSAGGARIGGSARGARVAASAVDLAEALAGHPPRVGRFGRIRVSGPRATRRALMALTEASLSLDDALRAGARIDPLLALRCLAYAVPAAWTRGHSFTVAQTITGPERDRTVYLTAGDGSGLSWSQDPPPGGADATVVLSAGTFRTLLLGQAPAPGDRPSTRGDHRAAEQLRAWADRVRRGAF